MQQPQAYWTVMRSRRRSPVAVAVRGGPAQAIAFLALLGLALMHGLTSDRGAHPMTSMAGPTTATFASHRLMPAMNMLRPARTATHIETATSVATARSVNFSSGRHPRMSHHQCVAVPRNAPQMDRAPAECPPATATAASSAGPPWRDRAPPRRSPEKLPPKLCVCRT
jgi:hypothetical protein